MIEVFVAFTLYLVACFCVMRLESKWRKRNRRHPKRRK